MSEKTKPVLRRLTREAMSAEKWLTEQYGWSKSHAVSAALVELAKARGWRPRGQLSIDFDVEEGSSEA